MNLRMQNQSKFARIKHFFKNIKLNSGRSAKMTAEYYQDLHDNSTGYQENNWLVDEIEEILKCRPDSLLEIGYGNGKFLRQAASRVSNLRGVDWAKSPQADNMPANVELQVNDVTKDELPYANLVCSADVLEHFPAQKIDNILRKLHKAGTYNYHVIACYDDRHSHLCILTPEEWLEKFKQISHHFQLKKVTHRNGDQRKLICVISNF